METFFAVVLTATLSFMAMDFVLGRFKVQEPLRVILAAVYAVLLVLVAGVVSLSEVSL